MTTFTVECTYRLPVYKQRTYRAATPEAACQAAIEDDDWEGAKEDWDCSGPTYITGIWQGADAAYRGPAVKVPPEFGDDNERVVAFARACIFASRPDMLTAADQHAPADLQELGKEYLFALHQFAKILRIDVTKEMEPCLG